MIIGVDKAQQKGKHELKHRMLRELGNELLEMPVPVGDYIKITPDIEEVIKRRGGVEKLKKMDTIGLIDVSVDTKKDMAELYQDLVQSHERFSYESLMAHNNGIRLIILVENTDGVTSVDNIGKWKNEQRWKSYFFAKKKAERSGSKPPRPPVTPTTLKKTMWTMHEKYGTEFMFCKPNESAKIINDILLR